MNGMEGRGDWRDESPSLIQSQRHVLQTGLYSDVVLKVGGPDEEFIPCHRFVLMSRSRVFATMLEERWRNCSESIKDSDDQKREILDLSENPLVTAQAFRAFLRYLYLDEIDAESSTSTSDLLDLLELAHYYAVPGLLSTCTEYLHGMISPESCVEIYERTVLFPELPLSSSAFHEMTAKTGQVAKSDGFCKLKLNTIRDLLESEELEMEEIDLFLALMRWAQVDEENGSSLRSLQLPSLVKLIRFPLLSIQSFSKHVVPWKVLSKDDVIALFVFFAGTVDEPPTGMIKKSRRRKPVEFVTRCCAVGTEMRCPQSLRGQAYLEEIKFKVDKAITLVGLNHRPIGTVCFGRPPKEQRSVRFELHTQEEDFRGNPIGKPVKCSQHLIPEVNRPGVKLQNLKLSNPFLIQPNVWHILFMHNAGESEIYLDGRGFCNHMEKHSLIDPTSAVQFTVDHKLTLRGCFDSFVYTTESEGALTTDE